MLKQKKQAFTLVELIIVITILAILATISLLSFNGYTKDARDSNRSVTLANIQKGVDLYKIKTGKYPEPDGTIKIGTYSGVTLTRVGLVGDTVSRAISMTPTPKDPSSGEYYPYGISSDNNYFQIGATMENYDGNSKVVGNYNYPLNINGTLYSIPSLIFSGSGGEINDTNTKFIVDKGNNVAYTTNGSTANNNETITQSLEIVTGSGGLTMTGRYLGGYSSDDIRNGSGIVDSVANSLGLSRDEIGYALLGSDYGSNSNVVVSGNNGGSSGGSSGTNSCSGTTQNGYTYSNLTHNQTVAVTKNVSLTGGTVSYSAQATCSNGSVTISSETYTTSCNSGYILGGGNCVQQCTTALSEITLPNGQIWSCKNAGATTVWDGTGTLSNCGGTSTTNCNSSLTRIGNYYQWGRNDPVNTTTTVSTYSGTFTGSLGHNNFVLGESTYYDWWQNEAGSSTSTRWSGTNPQGPCGSGRHVPSQAEWKSACDIISGTSCTNDANTSSKLQSVLKLPLAGTRGMYSGFYINQQQYGYYQSSDLNSSNTIRTSILLISNISPSLVLINHTGYRGDAYSVRCLKN